MSRARAIARAAFERLRRLAAAVESWLLRIYPYRRLRFTREGWLFLVVTMAIGFAALNTGHNLFYLIFAMLVSLVVVSGLLSERVVRNLRVERVLPREAFARGTAPVEVRVVNQSRRRASYAVEIRDRLEAEPRRRIGFIDRLDPGATRSFHALWTLPRRGRHRFGSLHLVTRFPFGLFEKSRIVPLSDAIVAFPAVDRDVGRHLTPDPAEARLRKNRLGEEMLSLRPRLPDDDPRRIHWRVSARVGELMVTEPGESAKAPVAVFFDSRGPAGPSFETAVEEVAGLLWRTVNDGFPVSLYSYGASFRRLRGDRMRSALAFLAEIEPQPDAPEENLERWRSEVVREGRGLFVTAGDPPPIPAGTLLRVA